MIIHDSEQHNLIISQPIIYSNLKNWEQGLGEGAVWLGELGEGIFTQGPKQARTAPGADVGCVTVC